MYILQAVAGVVSILLMQVDQRVQEDWAAAAPGELMPMALLAQHILVVAVAAGAVTFHTAAAMAAAVLSSLDTQVFP
jgi:hypothetical protein